MEVINNLFFALFMGILKYLVYLQKDKGVPFG
jgi:hypothetical protein